MGCGHAERGGNSGGNSENQTEPFTIEINRLHPQFNRARLHHLFHLPTPSRASGWIQLCARQSLGKGDLM